MKKRKPPVVLATCLVLMLVAVAIVYAPNRGGGDGHDHGAEAPPPAVEQGERPKATPEQISAMSKGGATTAPKARPMGGPTKAVDPNAGPSIAMPKQQQQYKPTPNESSTSTQWYTDQTKK